MVRRRVESGVRYALPSNEGMFDGDSLPPRCIVLNAPAAEHSENGNSVSDVVGSMHAPDGDVRRTSVIDFANEHALPAYSSRGRHDLSANIFSAFLDSFEMEHWTIDEINDALTTSAAETGAFVKMWGESWRFMGNVMNRVMVRYIETMPEDDRERLLERLQSDRAELRQLSD